MTNTIADSVEKAVRHAIVEAVNREAPGWHYVPRDERQRIVVALRVIAGEIKRSDFLTNRTPSPKEAENGTTDKAF